MLKKKGHEEGSSSNMGLEQHEGNKEKAEKKKSNDKEDKQQPPYSIQYKRGQKVVTVILLLIEGKRSIRSYCNGTKGQLGVTLLLIIMYWSTVLMKLFFFNFLVETEEN